MSKLIAVVNHIGGRMLITPERYRRGHYRLWEEPKPEDPKLEDPKLDPVVSTEWPQFVGAGWWRLSNGNSVRGEAEARRQQALLERGS